MTIVNDGVTEATFRIAVRGSDRRREEKSPAGGSSCDEKAQKAFRLDPAAKTLPPRFRTRSDRRDPPGISPRSGVRRPGEAEKRGDHEYRRESDEIFAGMVCSLWRFVDQPDAVVSPSTRLLGLAEPREPDDPDGPRDPEGGRVPLPRKGAEAQGNPGRRRREPLPDPEGLSSCSARRRSRSDRACYHLVPPGQEAAPGHEGEVMSRFVNCAAAVLRAFCDGSATAASSPTPEGSEEPHPRLRRRARPTGPVEVKLLSPSPNQTLPDPGGAGGPASGKGRGCRGEDRGEELRDVPGPEDVSGQGIAIVFDNGPASVHYDPSKPWVFRTSRRGRTRSACSRSGRGTRRSRSPVPSPW